MGKRPRRLNHLNRHKLPQNTLQEKREYFEAFKYVLLNQIAARDGGKNCRICGNPRVTIDHILPMAKGGTNDLENLQLLCKLHHRQKDEPRPNPKSKRQIKKALKLEMSLRVIPTVFEPLEED